jgi:hypothetical protein
VAAVSPYFDDGTVQIFHCDCRELDVEAACCLTSPPYNSGVAYDGYRDDVPDEEYRELAEESAEAIYRALEGGAQGPAWVNVGVARLPTWLVALCAAR